MFDRGIKNILMKANSSTKTSSKFKIWWLFAGAGLVFFLVNFFVLFVLIVQLNIFDIFIHFSPKSGVSGFNILAFGIDDTSHSKRSDAIIVLHLNKEKDHIGALSIPRDTRVSIPGIGRTRINHAFSHGGIDLLKESVAKFLGVPIDYYIKIDLSGVETLVNALGGLEINVEKALNYVDYAGDLYIDIPKGKQVLKGKKVMEYLRFRHDEEGDIGRIRRQQIFLDYLIKKILSFDGVLKLPEIIRTAKSIVGTDMSFIQMLSLTRDFKQAVKRDSISKATVPGSASLVGGAYYWKPNVTALDKVVEDTLYGFSNKEKSVIDDVQSKKLVVKKQETVVLPTEASLSDMVVDSKKSVSVLDADQTKFNDNVSQDLNQKKGDLVVESSEDVTESITKVSSITEKNDQDEVQYAKVVSSESLDDLSLTDYEEKLLYSEDLSQTFDNVKDSTVVAKDDRGINDDIALNSVMPSKDTDVVQDASVLSTQSLFSSEEAAITLDSQQDQSQSVVTVDRRSLFVKEVQRVASTGLLHDDPKFDGLKCEVLNGIGVPGIAKFAAKVFKSLGMVVPRFANAGHFDYAKTMIVDWRGSVDQSLELAHLLEIDPANIIVYDLPNKPLDFTVVLGQDWLDKKSLLEYIYETFKTPTTF